MKRLANVWDLLGGIMLFWATAIAWWFDHQGFFHGMFTGLFLVRLWTQYWKETKPHTQSPEPAGA